MQNWLAKTNAMWTSNDFAALDEITTAEIRPPSRLATTCPNWPGC